VRPVNEGASSPIHGCILLLAITFILAALVLLMIPKLPEYSTDEIPVIFEIVVMKYTKTASWKYENKLIVKNSGTRAYDNRKLYAITYRNGDRLPCKIPYINFQYYINNKPLGIQRIGGMGTGGLSWTPEAEIFIDYSQGTFRPGDTIRFEVYDRETNQMISSDTYPHKEKTQEKKMMEVYLNHLSA
jgi:flagellin-like protein